MYPALLRLSSHIGLCGVSGSVSCAVQKVLIHLSSVVSDSLWPHGLQHARLPCPSPTPGVYSNSRPLSQWCHPTISSSVIPFSSCLQTFPASGSFPMKSALCIRWPKYWNFSISPSKEYSGLISFRIDWFDLPAVQGTLKSFLQRHSSKASILWCSASFIVQFSHPYMPTGKTIALLERHLLTIPKKKKCKKAKWLSEEPYK